ncbi:VapE domain-containing protein [Sphingomonas sp. PAMC26645]|uniref:VapE domain-containing protein n=1 Tax=Sphingomonas sp. PAMC26645 TaxID=2565555 RepID=UPI001446DF53|nr:VapE domain-containing protein [Sphingomonas sp. PAMC26645]
MSQRVCPADIIIDVSDTGTVPIQVTEDQNATTEASQALAIGRQVTGRVSKINRRLEASDFPDCPVGTSSHLPTTIENLEHILRAFDVTVRYNEIKKRVEILVPNLEGTADNRDNATLTAIISLASLHGLSVGQISSYVEAIGDRNAYNPVKDWIMSVPWDGCDRLTDFCGTVVAQDDFSVDLKNTLIEKWMLSLVAAALSKHGFYARGVLTLQGGQGIGKTTWGMKLVSDPGLRDQFVKLGHHLDAGNKDSVLAAITHWIVEIGELDSSFRRDVARLKSFITGNSDKIRRPYAKAESEYGRRTVCFATVNQKNFLVDETGNSRFWTIPVTSLDYNHTIDMQQVYAQLAVRYNDGGEWWLSEGEEALLTTSNLNYRSINSIRDIVLDALDTSLAGDAGNEYMSASELLRRLGIAVPTNPQSKDCGTVLREICGEPKRVHGGDKWRVPLKRAEPLLKPRMGPKQPPVGDAF